MMHPLPSTTTFISLLDICISCLEVLNLNEEAQETLVKVKEIFKNAKAEQPISSQKNLKSLNNKVIDNRSKEIKKLMNSILFSLEENEVDEWLKKINEFYFHHKTIFNELQNHLDSCLSNLKEWKLNEKFKGPLLQIEKSFKKMKAQGENSLNEISQSFNYDQLIDNKIDIVQIEKIYASLKEATQEFKKIDELINLVVFSAPLDHILLWKKQLEEQEKSILLWEKQEKPNKNNIYTKCKFLMYLFNNSYELFQTNLKISYFNPDWINFPDDKDSVKKNEFIYHYMIKFMENKDVNGIKFFLSSISNISWLTKFLCEVEKSEIEKLSEFKKDTFKLVLSEIFKRHRLSQEELSQQNIKQKFAIYINDVLQNLNLTAQDFEKNESKSILKDLIDEVLKTWGSSLDDLQKISLNAVASKNDSLKIDLSMPTPLNKELYFYKTMVNPLLTHLEFCISDLQVLELDEGAQKTLHEIEESFKNLNDQEKLIDIVQTKKTSAFLKIIIAEFKEIDKLINSVVFSLNRISLNEWLKKLDQQDEQNKNNIYSKCKFLMCAFQEKNIPLDRVFYHSSVFSKERLQIDYFNPDWNEKLQIDYFNPDWIEFPYDPNEGENTLHRPEVSYSKKGNFFMQLGLKFMKNKDINGIHFLISSIPKAYDLVPATLCCDLLKTELLNFNEFQKKAFNAVLNLKDLDSTESLKQAFNRLNNFQLNELFSCLSSSFKENLEKTLKMIQNLKEDLEINEILKTWNSPLDDLKKISSPQLNYQQITPKKESVVFINDPSDFHSSLEKIVNEINVKISNPSNFIEEIYKPACLEINKEWQEYKQLQDEIPLTKDQINLELAQLKEWKKKLEEAQKDSEETQEQIKLSKESEKNCSEKKIKKLHLMGQQDQNWIEAIQQEIQQAKNRLENQEVSFQRSVNRSESLKKFFNAEELKNLDPSKERLSRSTNLLQALQYLMIFHDKGVASDGCILVSWKSDKISGLREYEWFSVVQNGTKNLPISHPERINVFDRRDEEWLKNASQQLNLKIDFKDQYFIGSCLIEKNRRLLDIHVFIQNRIRLKEKMGLVIHGNYFVKWSHNCEENNGLYQANVIEVDTKTSALFIEEDVKYLHQLTDPINEELKLKFIKQLDFNEKAITLIYKDKIPLNALLYSSDFRPFFEREEDLKVENFKHLKIRAFINYKIEMGREKGIFIDGDNFVVGWKKDSSSKGYSITLKTLKHINEGVGDIRGLQDCGTKIESLSQLRDGITLAKRRQESLKFLIKNEENVNIESELKKENERLILNEVIVRRGLKEYYIPEEGIEDLNSSGISIVEMFKKLESLNNPFFKYAPEILELPHCERYLVEYFKIITKNHEEIFWNTIKKFHSKDENAFKEAQETFNTNQEADKKRSSELENILFPILKEVMLAKFDATPKQIERFVSNMSKTGKGTISHKEKYKNLITNKGYFNITVKANVDKNDYTIKESFPAFEAKTLKPWFNEKTLNYPIASHPVVYFNPNKKKISIELLYIHNILLKNFNPFECHFFYNNLLKKIKVNRRNQSEKVYLEFENDTMGTGLVPIYLSIGTFKIFIPIEFRCVGNKD